MFLKIDGKSFILLMQGKSSVIKSQGQQLKPYEYFEHLLTVIPEHMETQTEAFWKSYSPGHQRCRKTFENKIYSRPRKRLKIVKVLAMDRLRILKVKYQYKLMLTIYIIIVTVFMEH